MGQQKLVLENTHTSSSPWLSGERLKAFKFVRVDSIGRNVRKNLAQNFDSMQLVHR